MLNQIRTLVETRRAIADLLAAATAVNKAAHGGSRALQTAADQNMRAAVAVGDHLLRLQEAQRKNQLALACATLKRPAEAALDEHSSSLTTPGRSVRRTARPGGAARARRKTTTPVAQEDMDQDGGAEAEELERAAPSRRPARKRRAVAAAGDDGN